MRKRKSNVWLEEELKKIKNEGRLPRLLLHACCAPCSSYVLEYLSDYFEITLFYYNPNITPESEYDFRVEELIRLTREMPMAREPEVIVAPYAPEEFFLATRGLEDMSEGKGRCALCYRLRLEKTAQTALEGDYDYFCTTLTVGRLKRADWLNEIGLSLEKKYGVKYLESDFKKKDGNKRSCELSAEYGLYRQEYCGCEFSKREVEEKQNKKKEQEKEI